MSLTTAVIASFNTIRLTEQAISTLRVAYPELPIIVVENGSTDGSGGALHKWERSFHIRPIKNATNVGHGPALHQAILQVETPFVLTLDSDCIVHRPGFIEAMWQQFENDLQLYAVGWLRWVDRQTGVPLEWFVETPPNLEQFCAYVHPCCSLLSRAMYLTLPPAFHHGAPMLQNMRGAVDAGLHLNNFIISNYVEHLIAGTRRRYGGKWDPPSGSRPGRWRASERIPI